MKKRLFDGIKLVALVFALISSSWAVAQPMIEYAAYIDADFSLNVNEGDALVLVFSDRIASVTTEANADVFELQPAGSLGLGATMEINSFNSRQVVVWLGIGPQLIIENALPDPSVININPLIPPGFILDTEAQDAIPGAFIDIQYAVENGQAFIPASAGGEVTVGQEDGLYFGHRVFIPPEAVDQDDVYFMGNPGFLEGNISAVMLDPSVFLNPVTVTLEYKDFDVLVEEGYLEEAMRIHYWDGSSWRIIEGTQEVNTVANEITIQTQDFRQTAQGKPTILQGPSTLGNVGIPTVPTTWASIEAESKPRLSGSVTIQLATGGVYTQHSLEVMGYQLGTGIDISLRQAVLFERHGYTKNAIMKITTTAETTDSDLLTMEYKDDSDPVYKSDIPSGSSEADLRIFFWNSTESEWHQLPGTQMVDTSGNTVTATVTNLADSQLYSVQGESLTEVDNWKKY